MTVQIVAPRRLFVEMRGIEQHQPRRIAGGRGRDDLAAEALPAKERQAPAKVETGVGEQHDINPGRL